MEEQLVRLEKVSADDWDGNEDTNIDFRAVFSSGRSIIFTAFTPSNIATLMATSYADAKAFVVPRMLIVRRIDEECLRAAVEEWLDLERQGLL